MKRAGFTMIELIFVIVILGILASVAVPKLIGVKDSAEEGLAKGFVGTLNRTVGASKWSQSLLNDDNGSLASTTTSYNITITDTDFPTGITSPLVATNCTQVVSGAPTAMNSASSTDDYFIFCYDGNESNAPRFFYSNSATVSATDWNASVGANKLKI